MAKLVKLHSQYGYKFVVNIESVDAIIYQLDGDAKIYAGAAEFVVPKAEAEKLEKIIDPQS